MIWTGIALLTAAIWIGLLLFRRGFWLAQERDTAKVPPSPSHWPDVVAVVPARDEADVIATAIGSLIAQEYPGRFRVVLVDDGSSDGTGEIARCLDSGRLTVLDGAPLPSGWTGKLWAMNQGAEAAGEAEFLWFTDADIEHAPDTLTSLVRRAEADGRVLVSLMARLHCTTWAERALIPAFVFFFQMLYPFAAVNSPNGMGGAAGGCMLVRRSAYEAMGGVAKIRGALIDDCTFGAELKNQGRIWLGLTNRSRSIRPYRSFASIAAMISRSAYAQLNYSPLLLIGTVVGMALVYLMPPLLALFGEGVARWAGIFAWGLMALAFQPMLAFYRRNPLWGVALPLIAAFYSGCTVLSAWQHWRGRGGMWKGRAQAKRTGASGTG